MHLKFVVCGALIYEMEIAYMLDCLCIFLVADYVQASIVHSLYQMLSAPAKNDEYFDIQGPSTAEVYIPCVKACATFVTASPVAAANAGGRSESLEMQTLGIMRVCPRLRGKMSAVGASE
jgi:hypothetical protein